jgi:hypothetical protein
MSGSNSSDRGDNVLDAEPLSFTVHTPPSPRLEGDAPRRTTHGRLKMLLVLLVCASPVVASYFTYFVIRPGARTNYGTLIVPSRALPDLPLTELDGRPVAAASLQGQWLMLTLGGGACDAACEQRLYLQRQLREMMGRERERIDKLWLVTDDAPLKPELRAALAAAPATRVLRVPPAAVAAWLAAEPGQALDAHLYIVDPMGQWMMRAPVAPDPAKMKRDIERLLRASASWDTPGR